MIYDAGKYSRLWFAKNNCTHPDDYTHQRNSIEKDDSGNISMEMDDYSYEGDNDFHGYDDDNIYASEEDNGMVTYACEAYDYTLYDEYDQESDIFLSSTSARREIVWEDSVVGRFCKCCDVRQQCFGKKK